MKNKSAREGFAGAGRIIHHLQWLYRIKQRYYPMRGFGNFQSAARFCHAFDELQNYLRFRRSLGERGSFPQQRQAFRERLAALRTLLISAS